MLTRSLQVLAIGASLTGLIACGKGVGEKNKLKVDGNYSEQKSMKLDANGKAIESKVTKLTEIKNGIRTEFTINDKLVHIKRENLIIQGKTLQGTEIISDSCLDSSEVGGVAPTNEKLHIANGTLTIAKKGQKTKVLKSIDAKEIANIKTGLGSKELQEVCLDGDGKLVSEAASELKVETTTIEEDKANEEVAAPEKSTDKDEKKEETEVTTPTPVETTKSAEVTTATSPSKIVPN